MFRGDKNTKRAPGIFDKDVDVFDDVDDVDDMPELQSMPSNYHHSIQSQSQVHSHLQSLNPLSNL